MRDTIDMAREAGLVDFRDAYSEEHVQAVLEDLKAFEALVRADERDKWMERAHTMILGEREACAGLCEDHFLSDGDWCAKAIRARGNT
jgi:hypothetical protein